MSELDLDALEKLNAERTRTENGWWAGSPYDYSFGPIGDKEARTTGVAHDSDGDGMCDVWAGDRESETDNTPLICECGNKEDARFIAAIANSFPALLRLARRAADAERERDKALREADREDRAHVRTLEERDAIQDLFDELYEAFFGEGPEYSSIFNATDAFNEMDARLFNLKSNLRSALSRLAALKEKCAPFVAVFEDYEANYPREDDYPLAGRFAVSPTPVASPPRVVFGDLRELARAVKEGEDG